LIVYGHGCRPSKDLINSNLKGKSRKRQRSEIRGRMSACDTKLT
jgi:hypothetical protein